MLPFPPLVPTIKNARTWDFNVPVPRLVPAIPVPNLTVRHFDPVIGMDMHFMLIPPSPTPIPLPYPHIAMVFDPCDYIPLTIPLGPLGNVPLGGTVMINKLHKGATTTSSIGLAWPIGHIPIGLPFPLPMFTVNDGELYYGSETVFAQTVELSSLTCNVLTCWGPLPGVMPLPAAPMPKTRLPLALYSEVSSFVMRIPHGKPVFVGGAKVPHKFSPMEILSRFIGIGIMKGMGKLGQKLFSKIGLDGLLSKLFKNKSLLKKILCKLGRDPIDLITGDVIYDGTDFELPGPIPISWDRYYYSSSGYDGLLGHGTHCRYDLSLRIAPGEGLAVMLPDGRPVAFELLNPGETYFDRREKLTLSFDNGSYQLFIHEDRRTFHFERIRENLYKPTRISDERGFEVSLHYSGSGTLSKITDAVGREIKIDHDKSGRAVRISVQHHGQIRELVRYAYDLEGHLCEITDSLNQTTAIRYHDYKMVQKTDRNGQSFYWEYDKRGRCVKTWGDGGILAGEIEYNDGYNVVTDSLGRKTTYVFDENNLCVQVIDPLGYSCFTDYSEHYEVLREIDEEGNFTDFKYDDKGNQTKISLPDGSTRKFLYNDDDRLRRVIDGEGNPTSYRYDERRLLTTIVSSTGAKTRFSYNEFLEIASVTDERGNISHLKYDRDHNLSLLSMQDSGTARWEYDLWGNCIYSENPNHQRQSFSYDAMGRVTTIRLPDSNVVKLCYNAYDEIVQVKDRHHLVNFAYTPLGSLRVREENGVKVHFNYDTEEQLRFIRNEHGEAYRFQRNGRGEIETEIGFDGLRRTYKRIRTGQVVRIERPDERSTEYKYDTGGRIVRAQYSDGTWETFRYDLNGHLIEAVNPESIVRLKRDRAGNVIEEWQDRQIVSSQYDNSGLRTHICSSLGANIEIARNAFGEVSAIKAANGDRDSWQAQLKYNAIGQEVERALTGGVVSKWQYESSGLPLRHTVTTGKRTVRQRAYRWDVNNRLKGMIDELQRGGVAYGHDAFANLAWAQYENGSYDYKIPDEVGNLFRTKEQKDRKYGPGGKLLECTDFRYEYDGEGNLILKIGKTDFKKWTYHWQGNGMLKEVVRPDRKTIAFEYDALGRRTAKIFDGKITKWLWDGNVPLHEYAYTLDKRPVRAIDPVGGLTWSTDEPIESDQLITWIFDEGQFSPAAKLVGDHRYSIICDYLGTPIQMYDQHGQITWDVEYDIYGSIRKLKSGSSSDCPFRMPGMYLDQETGLCYNRFRYYSPDSAGYLSQDPIGLAGNNPNFYAYTKDSNSWIDPFGLDCKHAKVQGVFPDWLTKGIHIDVNVNVKGKLGGGGKVEIQVNADSSGKLVASWFKQSGKSDIQVNKAIKHIQKELDKPNKKLLEKMSKKGKDALGLDTGSTKDGVSKLKKTVDAIDKILSEL